MKKACNKLLKFIGTGDAFNVQYGNNSAYINKNNNLLLIDCGCTTFKKLIEKNLLFDIDNVYVVITHTHSDHVGSLGDLIAYYYYILKKKVHIIFPLEKHIRKYLGSIGIEDDTYIFVKQQQTYNLKELGIFIEPVETIHVDTLRSFGYILTYDNTRIYYSGDCSQISSDILNKFYNDEIQYLYQDTCSYDFKGNPHLYLGKLCEYIKLNYRKRVYCMHYDKNFDFNKAIEYGFNIAENEGM